MPARARPSPTSTHARPPGSTLAYGDKGWSLVFSSADADHLAKIDAFGASFVTPVLEVPLLVSSLAKPSKKLAVQFLATAAGTSLTIDFGPQHLSTPVALAKT